MESWVRFAIHAPGWVQRHLGHNKTEKYNALIGAVTKKPTSESVRRQNPLSNPLRTAFAYTDHKIRPPLPAHTTGTRPVVCNKTTRTGWPRPHCATRTNFFPTVIFWSTYYVMPCTWMWTAVSSFGETKCFIILNITRGFDCIGWPLSVFISHTQVRRVLRNLSASFWLC